MRAGRKTRLARLSVSVEDAEAAAVGHRSMLRLDALMCGCIRDAMARAGIDPACATALRNIEARLADFVDTPELRRADAEYKAARAREREDRVGGEDPREWLIAELDRIGRFYADGSLPDFSDASFVTLLAWATWSGDKNERAEESLFRTAGEGEPAAGAAGG